MYIMVIFIRQNLLLGLRILSVHLFLSGNDIIVFQTSVKFPVEKHIPLQNHIYVHFVNSARLKT